MIASQAFCCASLILPHIRPARLNPAGGKFDQRCFCAVSVQSNSPVFFSASLSVARKAFAAATIAGVGDCAVLAVALALAVGAVAALVGATPAAAVDTAPAVAAVVGADIVVGCCAA